MYAITTKFSVSSTGGSRIVATYQGNGIRATVLYDHSMNLFENHRAAASVLLENNFENKSIVNFAPGGMKDGSYVWVRVPDPVSFEF